MLTERRKTILKIIVSEYVATAVPVASELVARQRQINVSPATVRHEVAELEEDGYIRRPHPSAGAVPSDKGYRLYVEAESSTFSLPLESQAVIRRQFLQTEPNIEAWARLASTALAHLIHNLAVVSLPRVQQARLRQVELVYLQEYLILLVIVLQEAKLCQRLIPLMQPTTQEELERVSNHLNNLCAGLNQEELQTLQMELPPLEQEALEGATQLLKAQDEESTQDRYVDGLRHILNQPEFSALERAHPLVELLEDPAFARTVLAAAPSGGVRLIIGEENPESALRSCSIILSPYGIPGRAAGAIAAIGPTRMAYPAAICGTSYISSLMTELLETVYG